MSDSRLGASATPPPRASVDGGPASAPVAWKLAVDLTGSRLGPGWRSVILTLALDWTAAQMREAAAKHYGVPLSQVGEPVPHHAEYPHDGRVGDYREELPNTFGGSYWIGRATVPGGSRTPQRGSG